MWMRGGILWFLLACFPLMAGGAAHLLRMDVFSVVPGFASSRAFELSCGVTVLGDLSVGDMARQMARKDRQKSYRFRY